MRFALAVGGGVLAALSIGACGGPSTAVREDNRALLRRVESLQAKYRRARRTVRDLQNRIILLEEELDEQPSLNQPELPVEVIAPRGDDGAAPGDDYDYGDSDAVAGDNIYIEGSPAFEGDVEVVYEGEAARGAGRPSVSLDGKLARRSPPPAPPPARSAPPAPPESSRATRLSASPRLAVVDKVPPLPRETPPAAAPVPRAAVQARPSKRPPPRRRRASDGDRRTSDGDPRAAYKRSYDALRAGDHARAIAGFRAFIAEHPRHDYADNAQYWLGEAYYDQKKFSEALAEFDQVARRFPRGNKVPDAMLKAAFCHQKLGDTARARAVLERIVREHPKTNPAALAQDRLAALSE